RPGADGASAVHTHMTNSWNTPVEVFEQTYPARIRKYAIRRASGGQGRYRGGNGIVREIELLTATHVGLLSDRRKTQPYGLAGGKPGKPGRNMPIRNRRAQELPGKYVFFAEPGAILRVETPGGGAWGDLVPAHKKKGGPSTRPTR